MPMDAQLASLALTSVTISFSADVPPRTVQHDPGLPWKDVICLVEPHSDISKANLEFAPSRVLKLAGKVTASSPMTVQVSFRDCLCARSVKQLTQMILASTQVEDVVLQIAASSWDVRLRAGHDLPLVPNLKPSSSFATLS